MVPIRQFKSYFETFKTAIYGINTFLLVTKEDDFAAKIKNINPEDFPAMIVVIPSADGNSQNVDNYKDKNTSVAYVLTKTDPISTTDDEKLSILETNQQIIEMVKEKMISDASVPGHMLYRLDLNSLHTDPEYNYMGCNGWSLGFVF